MIIVLPNVTGPNSFIPIILCLLQAWLQLHWLYLHTSSHDCWLNFLFCSTNSIKSEFQMEAFQFRSRSAYHMKACDVTWRGDWPWEYWQAPRALCETSTVNHHSQKPPLCSPLQQLFWVFFLLMDLCRHEFQTHNGWFKLYSFIIPNPILIIHKHCKVSVCQT